MRRFAISLVPALAPLTTRTSTPIQLKDFRSLVRIDSPRFSPDGRQIAFLTIQPDFVHDRKAVTLRVTDASGTHSRVLARGMRHLKMPRWPPDGKTLAFLAKVGQCKAQIYTVQAAGGTPEELSDTDNGMQQFAWSPDGTTIAYVTPDDSSISKNDRRTHHDLFVIHNDDYQNTKPTVWSHIWLLSVKTGKEHRVTGKDSYDYEYTPRFAPKGDMIAWLYPHGPGPVSDMDLFVGSPGGGSAHDLSADLDRNLRASFVWLPDAGGLVAIADDGVHRSLHIQPLHGKGHAVDLHGLNALHVVVSSQGALAVVADAATATPELLPAPQTRRPPAATDRLQPPLRRLCVSAQRRGEVARAGRADERWHPHLPQRLPAGKHYPLVVYSHGGPEATATAGFNTGEIGPLRGLFAADGYLVFEPNYRGSDNLGSAHEHAIFSDPGKGFESDFMSSIRMLEKKDIVDTSRIAMVGHSYGGYMSAWMISHHHFWKCAVVTDGAVDWTAEYEVAGAGNLAWTRDSLGGGPWDKKTVKLYCTGSPITYVYRADHDAHADPVRHCRYYRADHGVLCALPRAREPARPVEIHRPAGRPPFAARPCSTRALLLDHRSVGGEAPGLRLNRAGINPG